MNNLKIHEISNISFDKRFMLITIDGKKYKIILNKISDRLAKATPEQKNDYIISPSGYGIHWPMIDEDISIAGIIKNYPAN